MAVSGANDNVGFQIILQYDETQLEFVGFATKDVWAAGFGIPPAPSGGEAEISVAILGGRTTKDAGSLGHVTFKVLDAFVDTSRVSIKSASYDSPVVVGEAGASVLIGVPPVKQAELPEGSRGPIALDLDTTTGDQAKLQTDKNPKAGDQVVVDVVAVSGATGNIGFNIDLTYDVAQLAFVSFAPKGLYATAVPLPAQDAGGTVTATGALLGTSVASDAGSILHATFTVLDGFTGETRVTLGTASYDNVQQIGSGGAFVVIGGVVEVPIVIPDDPVEASDFSGDGVVDFNDFLTIVQGFGKSSDDGDFNGRIDLNQDGRVDFADFIEFARVFGQSVGG